MKDLGKQQSPTQNINIVNALKQSGGNGDEEQKARDKVMDKHLTELESDNLAISTGDIVKYMASFKEKHLETQNIDMNNYYTTNQNQNQKLQNQTNNSHYANTCNYNSNNNNPNQNNQNNENKCNNNSYNVDTNVNNDVELVDERETIQKEKKGKDEKEKKSEENEAHSSSDGSTSQSTSESQISAIPIVPTQIDKKVDKVFVGKSKSDKSEKKGDQVTKSLLKSPRASFDSRSPDRSKSNGSSPIKIIKVKSPRSSIDSGKRLSVSRDGSFDRSPDRKRSQSPKKPTEGILKRSQSPRPEPSVSPSLSIKSQSSGILKRALSPNKAKSPERSCLKKTLSPRNSVSSNDYDRLYPSSALQPRHSVGSNEYRSPDRSGRPYSRSLSSPRSSITSVSDRLDISKFYNKGGSPRSSFDSRSPDRGRRSLSASARSSFESNNTRSPEPCYFQYPPGSPFYRNESRSPDRRDSHRTSKSLDRSPRSSPRSSPYYPDYIMTDMYGQSPSMRSHSAENTFERQSVESVRSNESLARAIEYPTCVECIYTKKPS